MCNQNYNTVPYFWEKQVSWRQAWPGLPDSAYSAMFFTGHQSVALSVRTLTAFWKFISCFLLLLLVLLLQRLCSLGMGEKHCLHLFKISSALCGSWATGRNPEKLGCTCSIVAGSCDFERAHSSSLAGCLCYVTCTKHVKPWAELAAFAACSRGWVAWGCRLGQGKHFRDVRWVPRW